MVNKKIISEQYFLELESVTEANQVSMIDYSFVGLKNNMYVFKKRVKK